MSGPEHAPSTHQHDDDVHRKTAIERTADPALANPSVQLLRYVQRTAGNQAANALLRQYDLHRQSVRRQSGPGETADLPEVGLEGGPISNALTSRIEATRGSGSALDTGILGPMEAALGADFSNVRIHSDAESHALNRSVSARAFTTGSDIYLGEGASISDPSLLAHELTHVVQQDGMSSGGPMRVGPAGDSHEQEAEATGAAVTAALESDPPAIDTAMTQGGAENPDHRSTDLSSGATGDRVEGPRDTSQRIGRRVSTAGREASLDRAPSSIQRVDPPNLDQRVAVLEKRQSATELDLKWRAQFGGRLSVYRQAIYALTTAFQAAVTNFSQAQSDQAQAEAMKDQVAIAIINVGAAGLAQPFLTAALGGLGPKLASIVEMIENPAIQAAQGVSTVAGTASAQTGAAGASGATGGKAPAPLAAAAAPGGGDPLTFLTQNLQAVEQQNQRIEAAFSARSTTMTGFTTDQWLQWDRSHQESVYSQLLQGLNAAALSDIAQLEGPNTLATILELYFWSRWLSAQYIPGVRGLQIGSHLARRMRAIGIESLAGGIHFDTESWIFMNHTPANWDEMLVGWAHGYHDRLTH